MTQYLPPHKSKQKYRGEFEPAPVSAEQMLVMRLNEVRIATYALFEKRSKVSKLPEVSLDFSSINTNSAPHPKILSEMVSRVQPSEQEEAAIQRAHDILDDQEDIKLNPTESDLDIESIRSQIHEALPVSAKTELPKELEELVDAK